MNELFKDLPDGWYQLPDKKHIFVEAYERHAVRGINNGMSPGEWWEGKKYKIPAPLPHYPEVMDHKRIFSALNSISVEISTIGAADLSFLDYEDAEDWILIAQKTTQIDQVQMIDADFLYELF